MPPPLTDGARLWLAVALATGGAGCGEEGAPRGPVEYSVDLAEDVPMTGVDDPLFAELDVVMRQFLKWRCGGAGTLALSYKGRRVYKRGFGRMNGRASEVLMEGCGDDASNPFDPDAPRVEPDTPMLVGSMSKPIAAAVLRRLLEERLTARPELRPPPCEGPICACEEPPCPGGVVDLKLLDAPNDLLPAEVAAILRGDVPVPVPQSEAPCAPGHDPAYADPRWREITIGNLLSHQAGLVRDANGFLGSAGVVSSMGALRGYDAEAAWAAEDAALRAENPDLAGAIEAARAWVQGREDGDPVYFVHWYNVLAGERPADELVKLAAGLCLDYSPGVDGMYTDEDGLYEARGQQGQYSNFGLGLLGRVIDHLEGERSGGTYVADFGAPETHAASSLGQFMAEELGIREGVESPDGIFMWQLLRPDPAARPLYHPTPRIWASKSFVPETGDVKRPYCVWRGGECDFGAWLGGRDDAVNLRPNLAVELLGADEGVGFRKVPAWAIGAHLIDAAGGIVVEGPVYLDFARRYYTSSRTSLLDNGNGDLRERWAGAAGGHNGSVAGGYAFIFQLVGDTIVRSLPPRVDGHLVDEWVHLQPALIELPDGLDVFVAVNQNNDPRCLSQLDDGCRREYALLRGFVYWGLTQVDWAAVEAKIAAERHEVRGMALDREGYTHLWYADDRHAARAGEPSGLEVRADVDAPDAGVQPYALPSTRIGPDLLGAAIDDEGRVVAWYRDRRVSVGEPLDLASVASPVPFALAEGQTVDDLVALAMSQDGVAYAWYADGTWSSGTPTDLAALGGGEYGLPAGREAADVAAIAFAPAPGPLPDAGIWVLYRDGTAEVGTVDELGVAP